MQFGLAPLAAVCSPALAWESPLGAFQDTDVWVLPSQGLTSCPGAVCTQGPFLAQPQ